MTEITNEKGVADIFMEAEDDYSDFEESSPDIGVEQGEDGGGSAKSPSEGELYESLAPSSDRRFIHSDLEENALEVIAAARPDDVKEEKPWSDSLKDDVLGGKVLAVMNIAESLEGKVRDLSADAWNSIQNMIEEIKHQIDEYKERAGETGEIASDTEQLWTPDRIISTLLGKDAIPPEYVSSVKEALEHGLVRTEDIVKKGWKLALSGWVKASEELRKKSSMHSKDAEAFTEMLLREKATETVVSRMSRHTVIFLLKKGDNITWQFQIKDLDLAFGLNVRVQRMGGAVEESLVKTVRYQAGVVHRGKYTADEDQAVVVVFDNAYSILRSKTVGYTLHQYRKVISNNPCSPALHPEVEALSRETEGEDRVEGGRNPDGEEGETVPSTVNVEVSEEPEGKENLLLPKPSASEEDQKCKMTVENPLEDDSYDSTGMMEIEQSDTSMDSLAPSAGTGKEKIDVSPGERNIPPEMPLSSAFNFPPVGTPMNAKDGRNEELGTQEVDD